MKTYHPSIRQALRDHPDGLTVRQLGVFVPGLEGSKNGYQALHAMPDAYIDRWEGPYRGQWRAVWCVVVPPPYCPKPERKTNVKSRT